MIVNRRKVRAYVIESLYELNFQPERLENIILKVGSELRGEFRDFFIQLLRGTLDSLAVIDEQISRYLKQGWSLSRISVIDKSILRWAVYELSFMQDIPKGVTINEAVELSKIYGGEESAQFINGILGNFVKNDTLA